MRPGCHETYPVVNQRLRHAVVLGATLLTVLGTARLGVWQLDRAAEKRALQTTLDTRARQPPLGATDLAHDAGAAASQHYRPVRISGHWLGRFTVFLDNRQMNDAPGFFVVTPFVIDHGDVHGAETDAVLVQRGWAPRDLLDRAHVPEVPTPQGEVEVVGVMAPPPGRLFEFSGMASGPIRQNLPIQPFASATGLALRPFTIQQADSPATQGDGLRRQWPRPAVDVQMHDGYAFQWFALSGLAVILYVWYQLIRPRRAARVVVASA